MDLNHMLVWLVLASCAMGMIGLIRGGADGQQGWFVAFGLVIGMTIGAMVVANDRAGYIGSFLWLMLIVTPLLGYRSVQQLVTQQKLAQAARLCNALQVVHPSTLWRSRARLWGAMGLIQSGQGEAGLRRLQRLQAVRNSVGDQAVCMQLQVRGQWRELAAWLEMRYSQGELAAHQDLMLLYLRALGESHNLSTMLSFYRHVHAVTHGTGQDALRQLAQVYITAFCGRADLTPRIFQRELADYPLERQQFWLATALLNGGAVATAHAMLRDLLPRADDELAHTITQRLAGIPSRPSRHLQPFDWQLLRDLEPEVDRLEQSDRHDDALPARYGFVSALIIVNCAVFVIEMLRNASTSEIGLLEMGALASWLVVDQGEYWRIIAAMFLHWGLMHVSVNMLGLYLFGPYVAAVLGNLRFGIVYFGAGLGSMALIVLVNTWAGSMEIVVGASGCIMGLVGATGAIFWRLWRRDRTRHARDRLLLVVLIIVFQTIFDLSTPQVSFLAHFSGAMIGLLLTATMRHKHPI